MAKRPKIDKGKEGDELCANCNHMFRKHLFGGRSCADASRCPCTLFVPSGRFYDWSPGAQAAHVDPEPGDLVVFPRQREHLTIVEVAGLTVSGMAGKVGMTRRS